MDMRVDPELIISERVKRAWSQQHLATVAGLALRTIQRVESTGSASYETAQAIASSLAIPVASLRIEDQRRLDHKAGVGLRRTIGSTLAAALLIGIVFFSIQGAAVAEQVLLDVGIVVSSDDGVNEYKTQLLLDDRQEGDLPMEGSFNLVIAPTVLDDGKVMLAVKLYEFRDEGYELLGEPRLIAPGGTEAEVLIPSGDGRQRRYRIAVTPQLL